MRVQFQILERDCLFVWNTTVARLMLSVRSIAALCVDHSCCAFDAVFVEHCSRVRQGL